MTNLIRTYWKLHRVSILLTLLCLGFYYTFAYHLDRADFIKLCTLFAALFFLCIKLIQFEKWNFKYLLALGILFRLVFLFSIPNLSQDFYRFIWDGNLIVLGINPYLFFPNDLLANGSILIPHAQELVEGMGALSAKNYSNYPPLNQLLFGIASWFGEGNILGSLISMRLMIITADVGIFFFGRKLLKSVNRSPHLIFWYFLNPLVIIELSGNVHFEGVMLAFFIWALYLLVTKKWVTAALLMAAAISVKLIPLIFLPLFFKYLGIKKGILFNSLVMAALALTLLPFYSPEFFNHYSATISLWFSNFEFNASIYNLVKKLAVQFNAKPWELIKVYGKITPIIMIGLVAMLTLLRKNRTISSMLHTMLIILTTYFFLASTVHPWYIIFLLILGIYSDYRYPVLWSAVVILSYATYANPDYNENLWLVAFEYLVVFGLLIYESFKLRGSKSLIPKNLGVQEDNSI